MISARKPQGVRQQGVAAIELTLVLGLLMVIMAAVVSFSVLFLAQQRLNHLVGEAARQSAMRPYLLAPSRSQQLEAFLQRQAGQDLLLQWIGAEPQGQYVQTACVDSPEQVCGVFSVRLPLHSWFLAELLDLTAPLLTGGNTQSPVRPGQLHARAMMVMDGGGS